MKRLRLCMITDHLSAPCQSCKKPATPVHIVTNPPEAKSQLFCSECCPECGVPPLMRPGKEGVEGVRSQESE